MRRIKRKRGERILAWILCMAILLQGTPVYAADVQDQIPYTTDIQESDNVQPEIEIEEAEPTPQPEETETGADSDVPQIEENTEDTEHTTPTETTDFSSVYENGVIKIYNASQLEAIGSGQAVHLQDDQQDGFGTGEEVTENGTVVQYALDAKYQLMNEIELSAKKLWSLPDGFTGTFSGTPSEADPLYDNETDTIYVYNNYQLQLIASDTSEKEPVMSQDMVPENIGIGQFLYKDGTPTNDSLEAAQEYLTYSKAHRYVLAMNFTGKMPEKLTDQYAVGKPSDEQLGGRMHVGQQYVERKNSDGKTVKYILIGNEQQLRAIGSGKQVTPMLFARLTGLFLPNKIIPYYPGDTDFNLKQLDYVGYKDIYKDDLAFKFFHADNASKNGDLMNANLKKPDDLLSGITGILGGILGGLGNLVGGVEIVGLQGENTNAPSIGWDLSGKESISIENIKSKYDDLQYTSDANYIIFRNIDLAQGKFSNGQDDPWTPIHISGSIEGQLGMDSEQVAQIENIHVTQTGKMSLKEGNGIGFFGTISSTLNETTYKSNPVTVKNIHLKNVTVDNQSTEVDKTPESLVEGITGILGGLIGGLLEGLLAPLNIHLGNVIKALLTLKQTRADMFATGAFAGRITGHVIVENCAVEEASVESAMGMSGGFVGYTRGDEEYEFLSDTLKGLVKLLSAILNIIPGVGIGDLITILLENDVALGDLIPVGYYRPTIQGCSVSFKASTMGNPGTEYNGGFVGLQIGTKCKNCKVTNLTSLEAKNYAGGFAGFAKEAQIQGTLTSLGVETSFEVFPITSAQTGCSVEGGTGMTIRSVKQYAGGMNGIMTNSSSTDCSVSNVRSVEAESYAGGFTGRATIGSGFSVSSENERSTLLKAVTKLLTTVLGGKAEESLLSITGAKPSTLDHVNVSGTDWSVTATGNYAGGLFGEGDGVIVNSNTSESTGIQGLSSVAAANYAGGIGGSAVVANPIGVLTKAIGIGRYLQFQLQNVKVIGAPLSIKTSGNHAAGGLGVMLGGEIKKVSVENVASVEAANYAGGFAGRAGSGSLLKSEGVNLLGLNLVKVNNIIALAQGTPMKVANTQVSGMQGGMTIYSTGQTTLTEGEDIIAGGFVAEVEGMRITDSSVANVKSVVAEKGGNKESYAGGFAGRNNTGGLAGIAQEQDGVFKLPGIIDVSGLLNLVPYLIPEYVNCKTSFVPSEETGVKEVPQVKAYCAGGFFGEMQSGKVDNSKAADGTVADGVAVENLSFVEGEHAAGGFGGFIHAGAAASSNGLKLLDSAISLNIADLLTVLNVYIPKVTSATVKSSGKGLKVEATDPYSYAGGYAGKASGAQIKESNVLQLRYTKVTPPSDSLESTNGDSYFSNQSEYAVKAGKTAGGFVGLADIGSAASVGGGLKLLSIIQVNDVLNAIDSVATKITNCNVEGQIGGYSVLANGKDNVKSIIGISGGFVGECSGSQITNSDAKNFAYIIGQEASGGYVGCTVEGVIDGFTVQSENRISTEEKLQIAGGFVGYADLAKMNNNKVTNLKQVRSPEIAGGFAGKTNFEYLLKLQGDSLVVNKLLELLNIVLKALWLEELQEGKVIKINLGIIEVDALYKGDLVHINLLGLDLKIKLAKDQSLASIFIGDSEIKLQCNKDGSLGILDKEKKDEIGLNLIKGNRSTIKNNSVSGILDGYDVYGGNAYNNQNGTDKNGYAGGFVGLNREGLFKENQMIYADVIRGTKEKTGPFTGKTILDSVYNFNTVKGIEGFENYYNVYRKVDQSYHDIMKPNHTALEENTTSSNATNIYQIKHRGDGKVEEFVDLKDAILDGGAGKEIKAEVYLQDGAMAKLMDNVSTEPTPPGIEETPPDAQDPCKDTVQLRIRKVWKGDKEANRPDNIVVHITRHYTNADKIVQDETFNGGNHTVELTKKDFYSENVWEKVLSGQSYTAYHVDEAGNKYYYTYEFTEEPLPGYKTTITYDGQNDKYHYNHYNVTITNKKTGGSILPDTGGAGTFWIYTVGILVLLLLATTELKRRRENKITIQKNKR